jgi:hypothetical protein
MRVTQTILESMEKNMFKFCGYAIDMEENR